ncbi:arylsulfatase [Membranihabitans marinus]
MACQSKDEVENRKPNIIYILADDLGYGDIGVYGSEKIETPNIDALAQNGMIFTDHYAGAPVCAPSRCVLLTGKHMGHAVVRGNDEWRERGEVWNYEKAIYDINLEGQRPIPENTETIGRMLQRVGYKTAVIGKWGLGAPETVGVPNNQGFDFFYGYNCQRQAHNLYPKHLWRNDEKIWLDNEIVVPGHKLDPEADTLDPSSYEIYTQKDYAPKLMVDEALNFMDENRDSSFFLYFASPLPHVPLQAPQEYVDYYIEKFGDEKPYLGQNSYFPHRYPRAAYAAMVTYLDDQVGQLIQKLKDIGQYENTLVIFSSDNGPTYNGGSDSEWFNSAGPFNESRGWGKGYTHEGGIRVPMIASWPSKIQHGTSTVMSAFYDIFPTLADVAGSPISAEVDGKSLLPTFLGENSEEIHTFLYWEFPSYTGQQAVRMGPWKGIRKNILKDSLTIELYNLDDDIREENNVAGQHPDILAQIVEIMKEEHETPVIEKFRMPALETEE